MTVEEIRQCYVTQRFCAVVLKREYCRLLTAEQIGEPYLAGPDLVDKVRDVDGYTSYADIYADAWDYVESGCGIAG